MKFRAYFYLIPKILIIIPFYLHSTAASAINLTGNLDEWSKNNLPEGMNISATDWFRWSEWRYFDPAAPGGDPDYGYFSNRFRFGINVNKTSWKAEASLQYVKQASLPDDASGTPGGPLGLGAVYFGHNGSTDPDSLYIKYLNLTLLNLANTGIDITAGRFDYGGGVEIMSGNPKIDWIKNTRLDARLIGGFDWSIYQRSFDGFKLGWKHDPGFLSIAAFHPTQGGFEASANHEITDIKVLATSYTFKPIEIIPGSQTEIQFFDYYLEDDRRVPARADNSGLAAARQDLSFHTIGGHLAGTKKYATGVADLMFWGAYQTGDWFEQSHDAYAVAGELGYQFVETTWKPWVRIGGFIGSGDDNPVDGSHDTFYQILPTVRKYSFTTAYNLMNNEDYFIQLLLFPHQKIKVRTDLHYLRLAESNDLWYGGAGATQSHGTIQGFAGRPSGGDSYLGTTLEFTVMYQATDDINFHAFYGHMFGGDVVENNFTDSADFDLFFLETTIVF